MLLNSNSLFSSTNLPASSFEKSSVSAPRSEAFFRCKSFLAQTVISLVTGRRNESKAFEILPNPRSKIAEETSDFSLAAVASAIAP